MTVTQREREEMARIMMMMEGKTPPPSMGRESSQPDASIELGGPGQVTTADIAAMVDVLGKLNKVSEQVVSEMVVEGHHHPETRMALETSRTDSGVRVGLYQIMIKEDASRLAGKQYYSIYNTKTGDVIADDLSLYETALNVVKMMNGGKYANSSDVRRLFELDDSYTAHRQDALRYKRGMMIAEKKDDWSKRELYENRYAASIDRAMSAKKEIKRLING
jgi:hypothetical protein